ncbi:hypothetical protein ACQ4LE_000737 [Meloidogyne hapla]
MLKQIKLKICCCCPFSKNGLILFIFFILLKHTDQLEDIGEAANNLTNDHNETNITEGDELFKLIILKPLCEFSNGSNESNNCGV